MNFVFFCHSLASDWNHGNAHFLRGVCAELLSRGHAVRVFEPEDAWSARQLVADCGEAALEDYQVAYPTLSTTRYARASLDLDRALAGADVVLVHEWNEPALVQRLGEARAGGRFTLLFHDTHHRGVTAPHELSRYDLRRYDGVLAFGRVLAELYLERGWARRAWVWHEAADPRVFFPRARRETLDLVWVGNWGDEERTEELHEYLLEPVRRLRLKAAVHGVRYPAQARAALAAAGIDHRGFVPNHQVPSVFAQAKVTVHIPRRPYAHALPGIPTIRPFEALACGMPLVSAPWDDAEGLFRPGEDFWVAHDGAQMTSALELLVRDGAARRRLGAHGRRTVLARHTCAHRVNQLFAILQSLQERPERASA